MGPLQQVRAFDGVGMGLMLYHRAVGQISNICLVQGKPLLMQFIVKFSDFAAAQKCLGLTAAAEETGPVARSKCGHLVKKEKRGVAVTHGFVVHVLVVQFTGNPMAAGPAALAQRFVRPVKFAAAISQHGSPLGHGNDATVRLNAVLQGHGREPEWRRRVAAA